MYSLGECVYCFGYPELKSNISHYKKYAKSTNDFFEKIINDRKIEVGVDPKTTTKITGAKERIDYLCSCKDYWIIKKVLTDPLSKNLQNNLEKINQGLKDGLIKLEKIAKMQKSKSVDDKE